MRHSGSVLVVVLGLLAILAVVGVAFVTMSTLDRSTSASFALQTQMMLSADGAIEYTIHEMVLDVWEWYIPSSGSDKNKFFFSAGGKLLTGRKAGGTDPLHPNWIYGACEAYDCPSAADDAWLSSPITSQKTPTWMSFQDATTRVFGGLRPRGNLRTKPGNWPDNLGLPVADPTSDRLPTASDAWTNGIWIPDLVVPFNQYLVRTSVTVLDHNALVNLNAHGNRDTTGGMWVYDDCRGNGYFISDVDPTQLQQGFNQTVLNKLLVGVLGVPGCWGVDKSPGNAKAGAILCENPSDGADVPFTLDEEFELRRLWGTYFQSRLERFWSGLNATPDDYQNPPPALGPAALRRLKATTVSWTAEVRGDSPDVNINHATASALGSAWTDQAWSCPKPDLNTSSVKAIYEALRDSNALADGDEVKQVAANIVTFRRKGVANFTAISLGEPSKDFYGAQRQPFFTEATSPLESIQEVTPGDPSTTRRKYRVKVEVYNPWPGNWEGDTSGFNSQGLSVNFQLNSGHSLEPAGAENLPNTMNEFDCFVVERVVVCNNNKPLKDALLDIRLYKDTLILDKISGTDLATLESGHMSRSVFRTPEPRRGSRDNSEILILYVSDWQTDDSETPNTVRSEPSLASSAIPIRFPNCVPEGESGLPVRAPTGTPFKAFPRVGDLNQVLRFTPTLGGDPWIVTVSKTVRSAEANVKFDWMKDIGNVTVGGTAAAYAANVLSAGGPWVDKHDNDGDGKTDAADKGLSNDTEAGAPEFRVAGKINLNTAIDETLAALELGTGTVELKNKVIALRGSVSSPTPIKSPAQILQVLTGTGAGVEGRDEPFTRISNIATVRSDTFSIYGTVQVVDPASQPSPRTGNILDSGIVRSRRFWALVDRSPALTFRPEDSRYIRPRILNFQWLD